ncbi:MAG: PIG-L family deacetylase [Anaerolineae bacterium]|jgi:LmbE family N-acetylglucosaminyl deacetylase|nr:PIG-L family deacetylase [Anaerolineae bacterium]
MHLFLSPHPDDVVLSCGGRMIQLVQSGEAVTVVTLMAGEVPPDTPPTLFTQEHIVRWQLGDNPVPGRKAEDQRAVELLGSTLVFGNIPDALYRTDEHGTALYTDLKKLFGQINRRDPAAVRPHTITRHLDPAAIIYAPLGAGHHVDHQLVREAVGAWLAAHSPVAIFFYEEYPYSADSPDSIKIARAALALPTQPVIYRLSDTEMDRKIKAIACYKSQISTFWDDVPAMEAAVRQYAVQVGGGFYAERLWQPV